MGEVSHRKFRAVAALQPIERSRRRSMKRVLLLTLGVLAVLPTMSTAHDGGGIGVMDGPAQIADLAIGTPLTMPVTPPENVSYVTGDNGFTGGEGGKQGDRLYLGSYGRGLHLYDI